MKTKTIHFTRRYFLHFFSTVLALLLVPFYIIAQSGSSWSFGVIADTHEISGEPPFNRTSVHVIDAINAEFVRQKVDFVIQVGDLVYATESALPFQTRAAHNKVLEDAGIRFYPLRGNHDSENQIKQVALFQEAFPNRPGLPGCGGSSPDLPGVAGMTYSFTHKGGKFILLDTFPLLDWEAGEENGNHKWYDGSTIRKAYTVGDYLPWLETELKKDDHHFAIVFGHKNLIGQNHKDNLFNILYHDQTNQDAHPEMQNAFFACMQQYGVRHYMSGHDHMYHRSLIKSPDGLSTIEQIICGSAFAGWRFRLPKPPYSERAIPVAQEVNRVGFMIVRVDDERLRFEYYSTETFGIEPKTPIWELRDSFESSNKKCNFRN